MGRVGHGHERAKKHDSVGEDEEGSRGSLLPHSMAAEPAGVGQSSEAEAQAISSPERSGPSEREKGRERVRGWLGQLTGPEPL